MILKIIDPKYLDNLNPVAFSNLKSQPGDTNIMIGYLYDKTFDKNRYLESIGETIEDLLRNKNNGINSDIFQFYLNYGCIAPYKFNYYLISIF